MTNNCALCEEYDGGQCQREECPLAMYRTTYFAWGHYCCDAYRDNDYNEVVRLLEKIAGINQDKCPDCKHDFKEKISVPQSQHKEGERFNDEWEYAGEVTNEFDEKSRCVNSWGEIHIGVLWSNSAINQGYRELLRKRVDKIEEGDICWAEGNVDRLIYREQDEHGFTDINGERCFGGPSRKATLPEIEDFFTEEVDGDYYIYCDDFLNLTREDGSHDYAYGGSVGGHLSRTLVNDFVEHHGIKRMSKKWCEKLYDFGVHNYPYPKVKGK